MKSFLAILALKIALAEKEYGDYKLYRQAGGLIYDYSGRGFHGRNGNSIKEDSNDCTFTDRGLYLNGVNNYFLVHSQEFGSGPSIYGELSISLWIYIITKGPILHRVSTLGNISASFKLSGSNTIFNFYDCDSGCGFQYKTYPADFSQSIFYIDKWLLMTFDLFNGEIDIYENKDRLNRDSNNYSYSDRDSISLTYIGTDLSSYLKAFIFYIIISNHNYHTLNSLVADNSSGCNGKCYYNTSSTSVCYCDACQLVYGDSCLSSCANPSLASDCSSSDSSCSGVYIIGSNCVDCPSTSWPICDMFGMAIPALCHSECKGCYGSGNLDCLACTKTYANVIAGACTCPNHSTTVSNECVCSSGRTIIDTAGVYSCELCTHPCSECTGSVTFCTSCAQTGANINTGVCSCPSNSVSSTTQCTCNNGYVLQAVGALNQCTPCTNPCSSCSLSPSQCTACVATFNLSGTACICPPTATIVSNQCQCPTGFYLNFSTQYECLACTSPCAECSGNDTTCTACIASYNLSGSSCVCPATAAIVSNQCQCPVGFYLNFSTQYECSACTSPCSECSGSDTTCTACVTSYNLSGSSCVCPTNGSIVSNVCECDSGHYHTFTTQNECLPCSLPCSECSGNDTTCTACVTTFNLSGSTCICPPSATIISNQCQCPSGEYVHFSTEYECQPCSSPCAECSGSDTTCTACVTSYNLSGSSCVCPTNGSIVGSVCECDSGHYHIFTTQNECLPCTSPCSECSGNDTTCTACVLTFNLSGSTCICPPSATIISNQCQCPSGEYAHFSTEYECQPCSSPCAECSGSDTTCTACVTSYNLSGSSCVCPTNGSIVSNLCECDSAHYHTFTTQNECLSCTSPCSECSGNDTTCTACVTTFNLSGSTCICPATASIVSNQCQCPSGEYVHFSTEYECQPCSSPCAECSGSDTTCTACVTTYNLSGSSCVCPTNGSIINSLCECDSGHYHIFSTENKCLPCTFPCSECLGTPTDCTACAVTFNLSGSTCVCPAGSSIIGQECVCDSGNYMSFGTLYECFPCSLPCAECSGSDTVCTSCIPTYNLNLSTCECPNNSSEVSNTCACDEKYILEHDTVYRCVACEFPCSDCIDSVSKCTECVFSFNLSNNACSCPSNSSIVSSECDCDPGHLMLAGAVFECIPCIHPCSECSVSTTSCTGCSYNFANIENDICLCPEKASLQGDTCTCETGYTMVNPAGTYNCLKCPVQYSNIVNGVCECPDRSEEVSSECQCESGYLMEEIDSVFTCSECEAACKECSGTTDYCTVCAVQNAILNNGSCTCPDNSSEANQECVCDVGYTMENMKCVAVSTDELLKPISSSESVFLTALVAILAISTLIVSDPSSVWMILNSVQILSYLPLHTFKIPSKLEATCNAFKLTSIVPNIPKLLLDADIEVDGLPAKWVEKGFTTTNFLLNSGEVMIVVACHIAAFIVLLILNCMCKNKLKRYLGEFKYNVLLRLWVEIFIELTVASLISFHKVLLMDFALVNCLGAGFFVMQVASIFYLWFKLSSLRENFYGLTEQETSKYSSLFYEFEVDRSDISFLFYPFFLFRRLAYIAGLFYLYMYPHIQAILSLIFIVYQIMTLKTLVQFKDKWNERITVITESMLGVIFLLIVYYNNEISDLEALVIDYASVSVAGMITFVLIANYVLRILYAVYYRCFKRSRFRAIESPVDQSYQVRNAFNESMEVYALPRNIDKENMHGIDLNIENID